jgi:hypothetical protein
MTADTGSTKLAMAVGFFYVLIRVALALSPQWFLSVVDWPSRQGLYVDAGFRVNPYPCGAAVWRVS